MAKQTVESLTGTKLYHNLRKELSNPPDPFDLSKKWILLCGHPGSGKSTFALSVPRCCNVDTEGGACEIASYMGIPEDSPSFPHLVRTPDDLEKVIAFLVADKRKTYDMVCFDTLDTLGGNAYSVLAHKIADNHDTPYISNIGQGTGYVQMTELVNDMLLAIAGAGYGALFLTHLIRKRERDREGQEVTRQTRDLTARVDSIVRNRCQFVGWVQKAVEAKIRVKTVKLAAGKTKEVELGKESQTVHRILFRSGNAKTEEWLKARLLADPVFDFEPTTGWSEFEKRFQQEMKKRMGRGFKAKAKPAAKKKGGKKKRFV